MTQNTRPQRSPARTRTLRYKRSFSITPEQYMNSLRRKSVSYLKLVLPAVAVLVAITIIGWSHFTVIDEEEGMSLTYIDSGDVKVGELGLDTARFYGYDTTGQPFTITSAKATYIETSPNEISLSDIQADITLDNGTWITLEAREGLFERNEQMLMLDGDIHIFSDQGYEFLTDSLLLDLSAGHATSEASVRGQGPLGIIKADRFRSSDMGKQLFFEGNVHTTLYPATRLSRRPDPVIVTQDFRQ